MFKIIYGKHSQKADLAGKSVAEARKLYKKGLLLLGAFLLTLAITGGLFAYTYTTTSKEITVTAASSDFASITGNATPTQSKVFGTYRGTISAATMFDIVPAATYPGDLEVTVYLTNIDELQKVYSFWTLRLELTDGAGTGAAHRRDTDNSTRIISLENPTVSFAYKDATNLCYVACLGGSYKALPYALWTGLDPADYKPTIFCEVKQAGP